MQIQVAMKTSIQLSGTTIKRMLTGKTLIFHRTTHNITNTINQDNNVVWIRLNLFEMMNIENPRKNPHIIQVIPFMGAPGNTIFIF